MRRFRSGAPCSNGSGSPTYAPRWTAPTSRAPASRRRTGVLLGSSAALREPSATLSVPWGESAVAAVADTAIGPVEIHGLHVPNAANGWVKARTLQAVRAGLQLEPRMARVLCGDLNTPRRELESGDVVSFARDSNGRLRPERGPEWDEAELGVVPGLRDLGYRGAYRSLHGYGSREPSWTWQRISAWRWLAPRSPVHLGRVAASGLCLPPRLARRGAERSFGARG
jgi:hypothetical protein